jgi:hypothetical protein
MAGGRLIVEARRHLRPVGVLCLLLFLIGCGLPTDATLIAQFHRSRVDLERLRQMAEEDNPQGRIHADYADPKLPPARLQEYRRLMKSSGIMRLSANGRKEPLELIVDANGFLAQGTYKGYMYNPQASDRTEVSLDRDCFQISEALKERRLCMVARGLGDGWWLILKEYR